LLVRPSRTFAAFLFAGILVGLLTLGAGLLVAPAEANEALAIECATFPLALQWHSTSEIRLTASKDQAVRLDLDFLTLDGTITRTDHVDLAAGMGASFTRPTWQVGAAVQVLASAPVVVEASAVYDDNVKPTVWRMVPCTRITQPVRRGGP
jgi:hypothetical protein